MAKKKNTSKTTRKASKATKEQASAGKKTSTKKKTSASRARASEEKKVAFTYQAPEANEVLVTGSFCGWDEGVRMKNDGSGRWRTTVTLPSGDHEYRFRVDGEWRDDPNCPDKTPNRYGTENCVIHV